MTPNMLFDLNPKEDRAELFGRGTEIGRLLDLLNAGNWVAVIGPRMVGKTSLIKVVLGELRRKQQRKTLYVSFQGISSLSSAMKLIVERVNEEKGFWSKFLEKLAGTESFSVGKDGVSWSGKGEPTHTLRHVLAGFADSKNPTIIVFDEVQELYAVAPQLIKVLKNLWDTAGGGLTFVFSGSKFGMLRTMEKETAMSGRPPVEIGLKPFDSETSMSFLRAGLAQTGQALSDTQIRSVTDDLDGIVGYLTLFGNAYGIQKRGPMEALKVAKSEGRKIVRGEYRNFTRSRNREVCDAIIKVLAPRTEFTWSQVKRAVETIIGRTLNNNSFNSILASLIDAEYVSETRLPGVARNSRRLKLVDPLLAGSI